MTAVILQKYKNFLTFLVSLRKSLIMYHANSVVSTNCHIIFYINLSYNNMRSIQNKPSKFRISEYIMLYNTGHTVSKRINGWMRNISHKKSSICSMQDLQNLLVLKFKTIAFATI